MVIIFTLVNTLLYVLWAFEQYNQQYINSITDRTTYNITTYSIMDHTLIYDLKLQLFFLSIVVCNPLSIILRYFILFSYYTQYNFNNNNMVLS